MAWACAGAERSISLLSGRLASDRGAWLSRSPFPVVLEGRTGMSETIVAGYALVSVDPRVETVVAQREAIERYCRRLGLKLHGHYQDPAAYGKVPMIDRPAGRRLVQDLCRGDHVVVARLDRLADSPLECSIQMDNWCRQGIVLHILDVGCILNPSDPSVQKLVDMLGRLVRAGQRLIGARGREKLAELKKQNKRFCSVAPYGFRWQKRGGETRLVADEAEQTILRRVGELWLQGYSIDAIRQYLAYTWKVKNRNSREFGCSEVRRMAVRGVREMAEEPQASQP
jgi:DNA invertase Pin-like site-specific DNA recombinase